jgi:hypothetical protein
VQSSEAAAESVRKSLSGEVTRLEEAAKGAAARIGDMASAYAALHDQMVELKGNIRVIARVRPQAGRGPCAAQRTSPFELTLSNKTTTMAFAFDQVSFPQDLSKG